MKGLALGCYWDEALLNWNKASLRVQKRVLVKETFERSPSAIP
jgi:hypothetical protein